MRTDKWFNTRVSYQPATASAAMTHIVPTPAMNKVYFQIFPYDFHIHVYRGLSSKYVNGNRNICAEYVRLCETIMLINDIFLHIAIELNVVPGVSTAPNHRI